MKKSWYIFKEYYLISLIILIVLCFIFLFTYEKEEEKIGVYILIILFAIIFLFIDTFSLLKHEYYKPKKINRILNSSPFLDFAQKGFKKNDNKLIGQVRNYSICLSIEWESYQKRPNYYFKVLFNPMSYERFLRQDEHEKYNNELVDKNMSLFIDSIYKNYPKKWFSKISYNNIFNDISKAIDFLKSRKLQAISYNEWEEYLPKVEEHEDKFTY